LVKALPQVEVVEFENLSHMGPVTHPDPVNEAIGRFLERHTSAAADGWRPVYSAAS
jgi:pimeloyl-ACP methyl ester carboxylesterase